MTARADRFAELSRMQEARRQIQRQLDGINRQITRRMTTFIPQLKPRHSFFRRGKAPEPSAFLERYRAQLAALTAERQPEIDALSRNSPGRTRRSPRCATASDARSTNRQRRAAIPKAGRRAKRHEAQGVATPQPSFRRSLGR